MGAALLLLALGMIGRGTGALLPAPLGELKAPQEAVHHTNHLLEGDAAVQEEHHVLGLIVALVEAGYIIGAVGAQAVRTAQDVPAQGVSVEDEVFKVVENLLAGGILVAVYLIAHHLYLVIHLPLGEGALEHNVGKQLGRTLEMLAHEGGIDNRLFLLGKGIQVAPHSFHTVQDVPGTAVAGALKQEVLQVVRHAALLRELIARAAVYHKAAVHHRGGTGAVQDAKAAREGECAVCHANFSLRGCKNTNFLFIFAKKEKVLWRK